jgi:hypothetical protein
MGLADRARRAAASLKAEYEAGKRGDESPAKPIWATPQQQLDGLKQVFRSMMTNPADPAPTPDDEDAAPSDGDAAVVAQAMRGVDWSKVRAATSERTADAAKAMRSMAEHVDWATVQPVAAQVSNALIAAIATGQLGVGGRLASSVARAIADQNGLGQQVARELAAEPDGGGGDYRAVIDVSSREA